MNRQEKIEGEIQKTLDCFEDGERLPVDPYFYNRLEGRIGELSGRRGPSIFGGFRAQTLRPVMITALIALNIVTGVWVYRSYRSQMDYREQHLESFAEELGISQLSETDPFTI